jgi:hypothetical protein
MYCETTYKKIQDVLLLVDAAIMHVALLWALHSSGYDSKDRILQYCSISIYSAPTRDRDMFGGFGASAGVCVTRDRGKILAVDLKGSVTS